MKSTKWKTHVQSVENNSSSVRNMQIFDVLVVWYLRGSMRNFKGSCNENVTNVTFQAKSFCIWLADLSAGQWPMVRLAFKFHLPLFQIHAGKARGWSWPLTQDRSREQYWLYVATIAVLGPSMLVDHFFRVLDLLPKTFICCAVSVAGLPVAWDLRNIWERMLGWLLIRQVLISP